MKLSTIALAALMLIACTSEPPPKAEPTAAKAKVKEVKKDASAEPAKEEPQPPTTAAPSPELPPAPAPTPEASEPTEEELAAAEVAGPGFPKVAAFKNSPRGVRLSQDDDGTVRAKSTKPETKGQTYLIEMIMQTGDERTAKVTAE